MNNRIFDIIAIVSGGLFLTFLFYFDIAEKSIKFMLIPFLVYYYFGKYSASRKRKTVSQ